MAINGGLGLGYGSKYQLLRMLGWHRDELNKIIAEAINSKNTNIHWLDFGYKGKYDDQEPLNFDYIPELKDEWKKYWACGSKGGVNWDAIGKVDDTYILVEAKAHIDELKNKCGATKESKKQIIKCIQGMLDDNHIEGKAEDWLERDYQLANRLVSIKFLENKGLKGKLVKGKLVYLLFVNGYERNVKKSKSASREQWKKAIKEEFERTKIAGTELEKLVHVVFINCVPNQKHNDKLEYEIL